MTAPKKLVLLGSTGSIGTQTLDIVRRLAPRFEIAGLAANRNASLLASQAKLFQVPCVSIGSETGKEELAAALKETGHKAEILCGVEGMCHLASLAEAEMVVVAVAGAIGIAPTLAAIEQGKQIGLASKEVLVAAGAITMPLVRSKKCSILPIDSEHSAIFQCLQGAPDKSIERILLTASGGPFRTLPAHELKCVTPQQALRHPTWNMGGLVTINSATLMNKALEVIEACWLFDVPENQVEVVVHPQSIVHSMVRFHDGSTLAQMGLPDMRLPIQYALVWPDRVNTDLPRMEVSAYANLTFEAPDEEKFPALRMARQALGEGGVAAAVMNGANETAVEMFLKERITFSGMGEMVDRALQKHERKEVTLQNVLEADAWARNYVRETCLSVNTP